MPHHVVPSRRRPLGRPRRVVAAAVLALCGAVIAAAPAGARPAHDAPGSHRVRAGETLSELADRLGTTVGALAAANDIADPDHIVAGRALQVPRAEPVPPTPGSPVPADRRHLDPVFDHWAEANGFRPSLLKALCYLESGWQPHVVSSTGAEGVCQVMPDTEDFVEAKIGLELDSRDAEDSIRMGARYLRWLLHHTDWDVEEALGGYYQGLAAMEEHGPYQETEQYVAAVLALEARFR